MWRILDEKRGLARDALIFLPSKIVEGLIGVGTISYIGRVLSDAGASDFGTVNTIVTFSYLVLMAWLSNSMNRYVGEQNAQADFYPTGSALFGVMLALGWVAALTLSAVLHTTIWLYAAVMLTASALYQLTLGMLVQTGRRRASVVLSLLSAVIKPAVVLAVCTLWPAGRGLAVPAVAAYTLSELAAGLAALMILRIPGSLRKGRFSKDTARLFFAYGMPLMGVSLSISLLNQADKFILILFGTDFNIYFFNNTISSSVFTLLMAGVMRAVYPSVLRAHHTGGQAAAKPLLDAGARMYLLVGLPAAAGIAAVSRPLSLLLFGDRYVSGYPVMALAAFAMFFSGLTEYANKTWELSGNTRPIMQNALASVVVKIALSFALLPVIGAAGAAAGSLAGFVTYFVLACLRARATLLFSVPRKTLFSVLGASGACALAALAAGFFMPTPLLSLLAGVPAGALAYASVLWLTGEVRDEWAALRGFLKTRLGRKQ